MIVVEGIVSGIIPDNVYTIVAKKSPIVNSDFPPPHGFFKVWDERK
jgi:hypothetical protein